MKLYSYVMLACLSTCLQAIDNQHFYRANYWWGEPRNTIDWFTSYDATFGGGTTTKAHNRDGHKTSLLNLYGPHALRWLGQNVPNLDPSNPLDALLIDLLALPARDDFGYVQFDGRFSILEGTLNVYQNLCRGFFLQAYLPIRYLNVTNIHFTDLSPDDAIFPNKNTPVWQEFLQNFDAILQRYGLEDASSHRAGFGDFSILVGWAGSYLESDIFDFIDVNAKVGVLFPTAKISTLTNPFSIPLGYNGFFGAPLKFDVAFGAYEWLTLGAHIGALFLFKKDKELRLKTSDNQQGFISLTQGQANIDPGTLWDMSAYLKADHFCKGLSLMVGYSYNRKDHDELKAHDHELFNQTIINNDQLFRSWDMHVLHLMLEYDFATKHADIGPRCTFFYNYVLGGHRIFDTGMAVASLGIDIEWYC